MALSDFQKKKLLFLFRFLDTDGNKSIEKADFEQLVEKVGRMRSWTKTDPGFQNAQNQVMAVWEGIRSADADGDGQISEEEWLKLWSDIIVKEQVAPWMKQYQEFMFTSQDSSGDGEVDEAEFVALYTALGIPETKCKPAFKNLVKNGASGLTREASAKYFNEFILSNDPAAPGNFLFGQGEF